MKSECNHHTDCFTCPFSDCIAGEKKDNRESKNDGMRAYKREKQAEYRRRALKLEFSHLKLENERDYV